MDIATSRGPIDETLLDVTEEVVDDDRMYATVVTYFFRDTKETAAQYVRPIWADSKYLKVNQFDRAVDPEEMVLIEVAGVRSMRRAGDLVHRTGQVDDTREFTTWGEFWLPGVDVPVHREVHVRLKKPGVEASGAAGSVR